MGLIQLVYTSAAAKPFTDEEVRELVVKARANNARQDVTGLLLYKNVSFLQVLEGEEGKITRLFEKIRSDDRHEGVVILARRPVTQRSFPDWTMGLALIPERRQDTLVGFLDFLRVRKFTQLVGDTVMIDRIINGFKGGRWRPAVEPG